MGKTQDDAELEELADELMRVSWRLRLKLTAGLRRRLSNIRLSIGGYNALRGLYERGPCSMTALAKTLGLALPTVSSAIAGLEKDGLVVRGERDPADRRRVPVKLTRKGRRTVKRLLETRRHLTISLLRVLTRDQQEQFVRLYAKMAERVAEDMP